MEFCFVFLLTSVVIVVGFYLVHVISNQRRPRLQLEEKAWQKLAKAQELNFSPESSPDTIVLSRLYRDHRLTLRSSKKGSAPQLQIFLERQQAAEAKANKRALNELAAVARSYTFKGSLNIEANGARVVYEQLDLDQNDLDSFETIFTLLHTLITLYPQIIHLEEEAIPQLQEFGQSFEAFRSICLQMLVDICQQTAQRGKEYGVPLVCKRCFAHFNILPITLPDKGRITYYGCRLCGQSREFLPLEAEVVAVLNNQESSEWAQDNGQIKVNWLVHRELFDFDRVEIQQATDEEVERFAVRVGNDTDESRQSRYQEMACIISPGCQLSESAVRVLDHIFGKVVKESQ